MCCKERNTDTTLLAKFGNQSTALKSKFCKEIFCHNCGKEKYIKSEYQSLAKNQDLHVQNKKAIHAHITKKEEEEDYTFVITEDDKDTIALAVRDKKDIQLEDTVSQRHIIYNHLLFINYFNASSTIQGISNSQAKSCRDV